MVIVKRLELANIETALATIGAAFTAFFADETAAERC
jgi:hypothetical protein